MADESVDQIRRNGALAHAVNLTSASMIDPEEIVAVAEVFYKFLKGEQS